jgi:hypothetical protein
MIHADSKATNLVDQKSFYIGISRAKESATIFTYDRGKLVSAINERAGHVQTAIAQGVMPVSAADKAARSPGWHEDAICPDSQRRSTGRRPSVTR